MTFFFLSFHSILFLYYSHRLSFLVLSLLSQLKSFTFLPLPVTSLNMHAVPIHLSDTLRHLKKRINPGTLIAHMCFSKMSAYVCAHSKQ